MGSKPLILDILCLPRGAELLHVGSVGLSSRDKLLPASPAQSRELPQPLGFIPPPKMKPSVLLPHLPHSPFLF